MILREHFMVSLAFIKFSLIVLNWNSILDAKRLMGRKFSDSEIDKCINGNQKWPFEVVPNQQRKPVYGYTINNEYKTISPRKISSIILQDLKHTAEEYLGHLVSDAVISVPANYNELQRNSVLKAAKEAGLNVLNLINEPTAAAMAYGFSNGKNETRKERNIVVYDLGGGTFDVTVLSLKSKF